MLTMMGSLAADVDKDADLGPRLDDDTAGGTDIGEPAQFPVEAHGLVASRPRLELPRHWPCHCKFYHQGTVGEL